MSGHVRFWVRLSTPPPVVVISDVLDTELNIAFRDTKIKKSFIRKLKPLFVSFRHVHIDQRFEFKLWIKHVRSYQSQNKWWDISRRVVGCWTTGVGVLNERWWGAKPHSRTRRDSSYIVNMLLISSNRLSRQLRSHSTVTLKEIMYTWMVTLHLPS